jgi:hypothetical protein
MESLSKSKKRQSRPKAHKIKEQAIPANTVAKKAPQIKQSIKNDGF